MNDIAIISRKSQKGPDQAQEFQITPDFGDHENPFINFRRKSWDLFQSLSLPADNDEAWKRTNLKNLPIGKLKNAEVNGDLSAVPLELTQPLTDDAHGGQILMVNSSASIQLDEAIANKGVIFTDLLTAQEKYTTILEKVLNESQSSHEDKFLALSEAFGVNGIFLYIPRGVHVEKPLHGLLWTSGNEALHAFQVFVYLEENSSVTYVQENASSEKSSGLNLHSGSMVFNVGKGAKLNFVELQSYGVNEWNFTHEKVNVAQDGEVDWIFGALGSKVTKNFSDLNLTGQGATGKMSGFYFTSGSQQLDHDTQQNHLAPNTTSDLLFKGALVGESRSIWQGMIYVAENATKTDGYQANRNLVLSDSARADSIPGLEILTDDVRCTHGATVGKIDADQVFYLESRGIPRKDAEKLIVEGFFDPIMQRIPFAGVRNRFIKAIEQKMKEY